jgi:hypothetical protein
LATLPTSSALDTESSGLAPFVDRRSTSAPVHGNERRQFTNSHRGLSPDARELAEAIDSYKVENRRRYITFEEMLLVIHALGYQKNS